MYTSSKNILFLGFKMKREIGGQRATRPNTRLDRTSLVCENETFRSLLRF